MTTNELNPTKQNNEGNNETNNRVNYFTGRDGGITLTINDKEKELLQLICEEKSIIQIAETMFLNAEAIKKQKAKLAKKLGIQNTSVSFLKFAMQQNLFKID
ncbi:MAG: LuxR C-terminal-related transcriptional regulator [Bacteroidia bacterium]|nr:LuxR C-terminal-related transcriptional regulator [Bacteroidia bacterium]